MSVLENEWKTATRDTFINGPISHTGSLSSTTLIEATFQTTKESPDSRAPANADSNGLSGGPDAIPSLPRICLVYAKPQGRTADSVTLPEIGH
jgi:hypothetical protein